MDQYGSILHNQAQPLRSLAFTDEGRNVSLTFWSVRGIHEMLLIWSRWCSRWQAACRRPNESNDPWWYFLALTVNMQQGSTRLDSPTTSDTVLLLLSVLSDSATAVNWYLHLTQKLLVPLSFPLNNPIKPSSWLSLLVLHNVFAAHWDTSSPPILSEGKCIQLPETPGRQSKLLTVSLPVWTWDDFRCEMMCNALHCSIANARINQLTAIGDACHMLTSNLASQNMFNHGMQYIINYYIVHIYSYLFIHV